MKKTIFGVVAICFGIWLLFNTLSAQGGASVQNQAVFRVDQKTYLSNGESQSADVAPFIQYDRVYVPVRYLGYALGIPEEKIVWDGATQTVTFDAVEEVVRFTVGDKWMTVNEQKSEMDVAPLSLYDRIFVPARWLAEAIGYEVGWDAGARAVLVGPPGNLPELPVVDNSLTVVGSYENLEKLLKEANLNNNVYMYDMVMPEALMSTVNEAEVEAPMMDMDAGRASSQATGVAGSESLKSAGSDYSQTNVQVVGVDEADIVKTDGKYIYLVKDSQVIVADAYPAGSMQVVGRMDYTGKGFNPLEMYVDNKYLVIIGSTGNDYRIMSAGAAEMSVQIYPPINNRGMVKAIVCDAADKTAIKPVREVELEGNYVSSRKIGGALYLLANRYVYYYPGRPIENPQPLYRDTAAGNKDYTSVGYDRINCIPGFVETNYLTIAGINLDKPDEKAEINTYLGAGENIYASTKNLYVALSNYRYDYKDAGGVTTNQTKVYKFALDGGKVSYTADGEVPGVILNQFSMDENKGIFRIATTSGDMWRNDQYTSKNNVYNLNGEMNIVGKLEGIAPGERIYSVRFMGDRGYMVTFKSVDPFFVIDLKDPVAPKVLGALKIPGYSDYLHPYDDTHIIGFGKDTIELGQKGINSSDLTAYYQGMKMAVFDVSDVSNPVEMFKESIGDRGTESPLLHNHKALLFSKEKNLLALPVTVMEVKGAKVDNGFPAYGEFTFQGAYVYNLDLVNGFNLKGKITHLSDHDYHMAGNYWYDSEKNVERILYIDDILYTLSGKYIKANGLSNLAEINVLDLD